MKKAIIYTKQGPQTIDLEDPDIRKGDPIHQAMVNCFDNWINNFASDQDREMYFEPCEELHGGTYLIPMGAVDMGIDALIEYLLEKNITRTNTRIFDDIDLPGVFQS